ncbi:hypothetical protein HK414_15185 [Ramlibacter terrae]|uniref:Response regulator n=1 Tax=Ramlibacter terrae TaxID=2732511 RepID=A0ABX6P584_9BURK|nr:hypothetical protein HK414_15185 [Ramlibacter terrae]
MRDEANFTEALERGGWDLILSDYELSGFSGADAPSTATASPRSCPSCSCPA